MRGAKRKALVIGGGIGGLTAALALRRSGWEVEVFEQAPRLREVGSGLMVSPNAMRVLFGLGLRHVVERGAEMTHFEMCSWRGTPLVRGRSEELGFCADAPPTLFHRAALHGALHEALGSEGVHLGARLARFEDDGRTVRAWFEDGREARGEVLVGADGLRSVVRARLHPGEPLRYAGYPCWRGLVRAFSHPALPRGILRETQGAGVRFAAGYVREDLVYWWATANWPREQPVPRGDKAFLLETFRTAHAPIPELIAATNEADVLRNDLHDRRSLERWGEGRVTLLGDAAHPMMPNLGQGACSAIEDAAVLAAVLEETEDIAGGLRRYEARRQSRTSWLQRGSWMFGVVGQWKNPLAVWLREQSIRLTPMRVMMKQYEQLWGWRLEAGQ
ncbi:FAD-dependent monooxygenase [Archangium violaceum]|uniref:FAD-dependent monooxygenase n=1 Tax=Archangium violaceum TaxID=83451 RepID=UPI001951EFA2|nr:FAD-dependent monooxygenase [Archangium violaceum]QRN94149.1 FAD-dependent monooxygenase [Archangium violaceum]